MNSMRKISRMNRKQMPVSSSKLRQLRLLHTLSILLSDLFVFSSHFDNKINLIKKVKFEIES